MGFVPDVRLANRSLILRYRADGHRGGRRCRAFLVVLPILFVGRCGLMLFACDVEASGPPFILRRKTGFVGCLLSAFLYEWSDFHPLFVALLHADMYIWQVMGCVSDVRWVAPPMPD